MREMASGGTPSNQFSASGREKPGAMRLVLTRWDIHESVLSGMEIWNGVGFAILSLEGTGILELEANRRRLSFISGVGFRCC